MRNFITHKCPPRTNSKYFSKPSNQNIYKKALPRTHDHSVLRITHPIKVHCHCDAKLRSRSEYLRKPGSPFSSPPSLSLLLLSLSPSPKKSQTTGDPDTTTLKIFDGFSLSACIGIYTYSLALNGGCSRIVKARPRARALLASRTRARAQALTTVSVAGRKDPHACASIPTRVYRGKW